MLFLGLGGAGEAHDHGPMSFSEVICKSLKGKKIEGVATLITDPPPTSLTTLFKKKKEKNDT